MVEILDQEIIKDMKELGSGKKKKKLKKRHTVNTITDILQSNLNENESRCEECDRSFSSIESDNSI